MGYLKLSRKTLKYLIAGAVLVVVTYLVFKYFRTFSEGGPVPSPPAAPAPKPPAPAPVPPSASILKPGSTIFKPLGCEQIPGITSQAGTLSGNATTNCSIKCKTPSTATWLLNADAGKSLITDGIHNGKFVLCH